MVKFSAKKEIEVSVIADVIKNLEIKRRFSLFLQLSLVAL